MMRTYQRKLILTKAQSERIKSWMGACRVVYNLGLEIKQFSYRSTGRSMHKFQLMKQLPDLKKDFEWIKDVPSDSLHAVLDNLETAYTIFFNGGGFPKYASKKRFKFIPFKRVSIKGNLIVLPKIGALKIFKDSEIKGIPKTAKIIINASGFYVNINCENPPPRFKNENQVIGLDMGISKFCVDSNSSIIENPKHFKKYERQLRIENRSLARKKQGSNSWSKQARRLAKIHHKIKNVRNDFLHKESTKIAKCNSIVYMENLNIMSMSKNSRLAKYIRDCGWGKFKTMLSYKTSVIVVDPKYTSQTCFECGDVNSKSRISQSEFCCVSCGSVSNADENAAKNILSKGIALSRKRESLGCALAL